MLRLERPPALRWLSAPQPVPNRVVSYGVETGTCTAVPAAGGAVSIDCVVPVIMRKSEIAATKASVHAATSATATKGTGCLRARATVMLPESSNALAPASTLGTDPHRTQV